MFLRNCEALPWGNELYNTMKDAGLAEGYWSCCSGKWMNRPWGSFSSWTCWHYHGLNISWTNEQRDVLLLMRYIFFVFIKQERKVSGLNGANALTSGISADLERNIRIRRAQLLIQNRCYHFIQAVYVLLMIWADRCGLFILFSHLSASIAPFRKKASRRIISLHLTTSIEFKKCVLRELSEKH